MVKTSFCSGDVSVYVHIEREVITSGDSYVNVCLHVIGWMLIPGLNSLVVIFTHQ